MNRVQSGQEKRREFDLLTSKVNYRLRILHGGRAHISSYSLDRPRDKTWPTMTRPVICINHSRLLLRLNDLTLDAIFNDQPSGFTPVEC